MHISSDMLKDALRKPILLGENRVYRFYQGGKLIDQFRGAANPHDNEYPEDWVGSITPANNPGSGHPPGEGLSVVTLPNGEQMTLRAILEQLPEEALGAEHVARFGASSGLLVKLLDSSVRLPIHCHPTRPFARQHFDSIFGKTEAWIVVETRDLGGIDPYIMLGFKEGVEKQTFRRQVERQEIDDMKAGLHRVPVKPGDVFYVKAGLPHAIGEGVFLVELQEPTDFSIVAEWQGFPIAPEDAHIGLGWDTAIDCFDFTHYRPQQLLDEYRLEPQLLRQEAGGAEWQLLGGKTAPFFSCTRLVTERVLPVENAGFYVGVVTSGTGRLAGEFGDLKLQRGDSFVCSAAVASHAFVSDGDQPLEIMRCLPPNADGAA